MKKFIGILLIALALVLVISSSANFREYQATRQVRVSVGEDPYIDVSCKAPLLIVENNLDEIVYIKVVRDGCSFSCPRWWKVYPGEIVPFFVFPGDYTVYATWDGGGARIHVKCKSRCWIGEEEHEKD
ncbi:hypothetical protein PFDSM3638_01590 [Pyrococcus furiosus DSM 3638]|uniref:Uncharacterized protein n=3 Tax=Pyrococcus furiosus TaxID=2261 RepID=Q8U3X4_PYRFU|nr:hypothetical protein [Pyrococcus furiosus]AAL80451.1 hypothetical protein PF0327 [Pyrococcus furiosus DSM 3638]AFN03116.1 hypothetical protein PFC_00715 [Pyrococcus furiosus COM1]QEK78043.1 hypothetical protein PFDSM3638_01590 [Pyrococcus furiosus DSM 3638]